MVAGTKTTLLITLIALTGCTRSDLNTLSSSLPMQSGKFECRPPRHYQYTIPSQSLNCYDGTSGTANNFKFSVPDEGHALARATFEFTNNSAKNEPWFDAAVVVGDGVVAFANGGDICPGATMNTSFLGYGNLSAANGSALTIQAWENHGGLLCDGLVVASGTVDIWVEDPSPSCIGNDIGLTSSYQTSYLGLTNLYYWTNTMSQMMSIDVPASSDRSQIMVFASIDGSPNGKLTYSCSGFRPDLASEVWTNHGMVAYDTEELQGFSTMGHLVLSETGTTSYDPSITSVSLMAGATLSDLTPIQTGGCCGDGKVGFVKLK